MALQWGNEKHTVETDQLWQIRDYASNLRYMIFFQKGAITMEWLDFFMNVSLFMLAPFGRVNGVS